MSLFIHYASLRYGTGTANKRPNIAVQNENELEELRKKLCETYKADSVTFVTSEFDGELTEKRKAELIAEFQEYNLFYGPFK